MLNYLNDPELVARFQRLCGVVPGNNGSKTTDEREEESNSKAAVTKGAWHISKHLFEQNGSVPEEIYYSDERRKKHMKKPTKETDDGPCFKITNPHLDLLFRFATNLGNEVFFITVLPFWYWNIDGYVVRNVCYFWSIFMYIGQVTKDLIRWPRPASPPCFKLDAGVYREEFGMPSTHAMGGVGIPFTMFALTVSRYQVMYFL